MEQHQNSPLWPQSPFGLDQASSVAHNSDVVLSVINLISLIFGTIVCVAIVFFAMRYRRGSKVNRTLPAHEGVALELTWTIIPLIIAVGLAIYSAGHYFDMIRPPANAMEVYVVGKQWMWKLQHPSGRWEMNELHVPLGRPVKLTMISEDVIHDFWVPAFRVKQDVIPGRYTQLWFEPTKVGRYHIFCSQYCGTNHAIMGGYVTVMEPADFDRWMSTGNLNPSVASGGERLFRSLGCTGCHGQNANVRAPSLEGIYNKPVAIEVPQGNGTTQTTTTVADFRYLHDSIILPEKEIAAGYKAIMPSYKNRLSEEELVQIIDYIRSLGSSNGTSNGSARAYDPNGNLGGSAGGPVGGRGYGGSGAANGSMSGRSTNPGGNSGTTGGSRGKTTGDMSNMLDREATLRGNDVGGAGILENGGTSGTNGSLKGNATGDMSNMLDREAVFSGSNDAARVGLADNSHGGMKNEGGARDRLGVYRSDNYARSAARAYSGLQPGNGAGGNVSRAIPSGPQTDDGTTSGGKLSTQNKSGTRPTPAPGAKTRTGR